MKKRALSLLEIMIVIFLITLITGAIGYNMRGTLEKGRVFRTEQAKEQLHDLLLIALSEFENPDAIAQDPETYLTRLGIVKDPKGLLQDGWKQKFEIRLNRSKTDFTVRSERLEKYREREQRSAANSQDEEK